MRNDEYLYNAATPLAKVVGPFYTANSRVFFSKVLTEFPITDSTLLFRSWRLRLKKVNKVSKLDIEGNHYLYEDSEFKIIGKRNV